MLRNNQAGLISCSKALVKLKMHLAFGQDRSQAILLDHTGVI
jgi:hypothetical protein